MPLLSLTALSLAVLGTPADAPSKELRRLGTCATVLEEVLAMPEGIPADLLDKADCVAVIPGVKKAAFVIGGRWGKGAVVCRTNRGRGPWGPPLMLSLGGGSIGLQIGGQATDLVLLFMNPRGIDHLLESKFTLGADCSIAAGPKGRTLEAATDAQMQAEILAYSRSRGLFAGLSLEGAVVKQDKDANEVVYGMKVPPRELLLAPGQAIPAAARPVVDVLTDASPRHAPASDGKDKT
jgi:lipid-binding SYLF domain-containing protein